MSAIKLSICIPTYNRRDYLRTALEQFAGYAFSFPYEIVISDNASTDDTTQLVEEFIGKGLPIHYHRRAENGGAGPNIFNAYLQAVGQYVMLHADDDFLVASGIEEAIAYLDANDDVVACHAPWYLYDEVQDRDVSLFYQVEQDTKFPRQNFVELFQFMYDNHVFPEIGIYRATALRTAWLPRELCFWAFSCLAHYLDQGAVAFLQKPFYRSVTVSKVAPTRQQAGIDDVMTGWDMYRGGLEYFLHIAAVRGKLNTSEEACAVYDQMCKIFTMTRMSVAVRFWVARHDYLKAYEIYTRMAMGGFGEHPEVIELRKLFPVMVALQTLAYLLNSASGVSHLVLSDIDDPDYIATLLREVGLGEEIAIVSKPSALDASLIGTSALFSTTAAGRDSFITQGYRSNFIFIESELAQYTLI
ncbi:MAG TPA: glycosyltransferase family 2 protein [Sphingobium sp.]